MGGKTCNCEACGFQKRVCGAKKKERRKELEREDTQDWGRAQLHGFQKKKAYQPKNAFSKWLENGPSSRTELQKTKSNSQGSQGEDYSAFFKTSSSRRLPKSANWEGEKGVNKKGK